MAGGQGVRHFQHGRGARGIVIGAVHDGAVGFDAEMVHMGGDEDDAGLGVAARQVADGVGGHGLDQRHGAQVQGRGRAGGGCQLVEDIAGHDGAICRSGFRRLVFEVGRDARRAADAAVQRLHGVIVAEQDQFSALGVGGANPVHRRGRAGRIDHQDIAGRQGGGIIGCHDLDRAGDIVRRRHQQGQAVALANRYTAGGQAGLAGQFRRDDPGGLFIARHARCEFQAIGLELRGDIGGGNGLVRRRAAAATQGVAGQEGFVGGHPLRLDGPWGLGVSGRGQKSRHSENRHKRAHDTSPQNHMIAFVTV